MEVGEPQLITVQHFALATNVPTPLMKLLFEFEAVNAGMKPIISEGRKEEVRLFANEHWVVFPDSLFFSPAVGSAKFRARGGIPEESPSVKDVMEIFKTAVGYDGMGVDEAAWNSGVHHPLLKMAIPLGSFLSVVPCTTARVCYEFLPTESYMGKMVDFCLAIKPTWPSIYAQPQVTDAIDNIRKLLPGLSINHSGYFPEWPIGLSIETKGMGGVPIQLGAWQGEQWRLLDSLVRQREQVNAAGNGQQKVDMKSDDLGADRPAEAGTRAGSSTRFNTGHIWQNPPAAATGLKGLSFLPAIYITNHQWKFAATTWDGDPEKGTTLWIGCTIGSTESLVGIYRIIWAIRRLAQFIGETYWPWYLKHVLGFEETQVTGVS